MTFTTKEAPWAGASPGDAGACNRAGLAGQQATADASSLAQSRKAALTEHNQRVYEWGKKFDPKYRKVVKVLGWMADLDTRDGSTITAEFKLETFRRRYRKFRFGDVGRATVYRRFQELERAGVLRRISQYRNDGKQRASKYVIDFSLVIQNGKPVRTSDPRCICSKPCEPACPCEFCWQVHVSHKARVAEARKIGNHPPPLPSIHPCQPAPPAAGLNTGQDSDDWIDGQSWADDLPA